MQRDLCSDRAGIWNRICPVSYTHLVHELALPTLPGKEQWYLLADTGREDVFLKEREKPLPRKQKMILVEPHTILILEGAKYETD